MTADEQKADVHNATPDGNHDAAITSKTPSQKSVSFDIDEEIDRNNNSDDDDCAILPNGEFSTYLETRALLKNIFLISIQILFEVIPPILSTIMVGHYYDGQNSDDIYVSAIGLATTFSYVTGEAFTWGFTTALYTLVPQATGYAKPGIPLLSQQVVKNALAIHLQRSFIITLALSIPLVCLQFASGKIMTLIGEPEKLEDLIRNYSVSLIPWIIGSAVFTAIQRVCQALDFNWLLFFITLFGAVISFPLMYILMYVKGCGEYGYLATGIAQSIAYWLMIFVTIIVLIYRGYGFLFNFKSFGISILCNKEDVKAYIKLSLPGFLQYAFEWWVLEIAMVVSGYVGKDSSDTTISISCSVIMYNLYLVALSWALGISNAVNIRVGKYIGGNNILFARKTAKLGLLICCLFVGVCIGTFIFGRNDITAVFTHNVRTDDVVSKVLFSFSYFCTFLLFTQFFGGLYRGLGAQDKSATFVLLSYYFVSIPMLFILLFGLS